MPSRRKQERSGAGTIVVALGGNAVAPGDVRPTIASQFLHTRQSLAPVIELMQTLNAETAASLRGIGPHAVTDVTGFGLLGHAYELATRSGVRVELDANLLPVIPAALELARAGVITGGDRRNREYVGNALEAHGVPAEQLIVAFDPQTAGGLLVSLPPDRTPVGTRIGAVAEGDGVRLSA